MTITKSKQRISDFQSHINSNAQRIRDAGNEAWRLVKTKGEVEIVRQFLVGRGRGTDYLNANLTKALGTGGRVVKFASMFLHQVPKVFGITNHPPATPSKLPAPCELGDLQTLFLYLDRTKNVRQVRSVIFQAKLNPAGGAYVIDHPEQRPLYDTCPRFVYESVLKGEFRDLPGGHLRERALQYLFVDERSAQGDRLVRVRTIPADAGSGAFENYGEHLLRFLNDSTGLDVPPSATTKDTWGRVVWDMINHVADAVSKATPVRKSGLEGLLDHFNHFESHEEFSIDTTNGEPFGNGGGGFGLQLIIVWDPELGDENAWRTERPRASLPQELGKMADEYLKINEPDYNKRVQLKDKLAGEMADFALRNKISPCELAEVALHFKHEGLIVAAAAAHVMKPGYDPSHLLRAAGYATRKHVQFKIIQAFRAAHERINLSHSSRKAYLDVAKGYLNGADAPLKRAIEQLRQDWIKADDEQPKQIRQSH